MSSLAWGIAGGLSALSAVLTAPTQGLSSGDSFGPSLLLRALTGAVLARMYSLPVALAAGVGLGVVEQILLFHSPRGGTVELSLFGIILVSLLLQRARSGREEGKGSWASVQAWKPVPDELKKAWPVRNLGRVTGLTALAAGAAIPLALSQGTAVTLTNVVSFAIVGISIGILTGLGGQLTLGQFAVAAVGGAASVIVANFSGSIVLGLIYATGAGALTSVLLGLPALRIRGLMLTVTTLSFALMAPVWLLNQRWMFGTGRQPLAPTLFGWELEPGRRYYYFALALLTVVCIVSSNVRRGGLGRLLIAIRDNEDNARAFSVSATRVKLQAYVVAGGIAGIGGAVYAHSLSDVSGSAFPTATSIDVVSMTVIGGISVLAGPILGSLYVVGVPAFLPLDAAGIAATKLGALLLILYLPAGIAQMGEPLRDRLVRRIARKHEGPIGTPAPERRATAALGEVTARLRPVSSQRPGWSRSPSSILRAERLSKSYGGVAAVREVSLDVVRGETLGLIGPNGAGKTTTFELLAGFTRPDVGRVVLDGRDVTSATPEARAKLGLIRSFQDAALFPTMTVVDCVMLALERAERTSLLSSLSGLGGAEHRKAQSARDIVGAMGLYDFRDKAVQSLSTGTRRIAELACLVALQPKVLLLDEPSSGVAQRETERLSELLAMLKRDLDVTLVVIEHDIPLIMSISDRVVAMADGLIIAVGSPSDVRADERVVEAYMGGDVTAIERSGVATAYASAT